MQDEDREYREQDNVARFHFDYDETICMVEKFPEAMATEGVIQHPSDDMGAAARDTPDVPAPDLVAAAPEVACPMCVGGTYYCEICKQNCCTPCSGYDADDTEGNLLHNRGQAPDVRNHPRCVKNRSEAGAKTSGVKAGRKEVTNQLHVVAPGEGKIPISHTYAPDWDAKAFPNLHPDGKNHLTDSRQKKLGDLPYFHQRLCNMDPRWRKHPHWVFSAAVYR